MILYIHGAIPVNCIIMSVELPSHMVVEPLKVAVGIGNTLTSTDPVPVPKQSSSLYTVPTLYVVFTVGVTVTVSGEELALCVTCTHTIKQII